SVAIGLSGEHEAESSIHPSVMTRDAAGRLPLATDIRGRKSWSHDATSSAVTLLAKNRSKRVLVLSPAVDVVAGRRPLETRTSGARPIRRVFPHAKLTLFSPRHKYPGIEIVPGGKRQLFPARFSQGSPGRMTLSRRWHRSGSWRGVHVSRSFGCRRNHLLVARP